jgi:hypothetical protein
MLAPAARRAAARARQRRWRQRQRNGRCMFKIEVDEHALADAAIEAGVLTPAETLRREKLAEVAQGVLVAWLEHWRKR